jgi:hypothetical protein
MKTPAPLTAPPVTSPLEAQPSLAGRAATAPDSVLVKSAAQHLFLQPRKFRLKHLLTLMALLLAAVLAAGIGYLKYQTLRRLRIESAVTEKFNTAQSLTLRQAELRVFVSDTREVTLDGKVASKEDFDAAGDLAASVPGVTHVINRVGYPVVPAVDLTGIQAESFESLISNGIKLLDDGKYEDAITCFSKAAAADPNNKSAKELLDRAHLAQKTEEQLLKNRR